MAAVPIEIPFDDIWLRRFGAAREPSVRLVCLPHAGGSASAFFALHRELPPSVDCVAVQYPGRQERRHEPPLRNARALAARVASVLEPLTDLPLVLFGHSMGAVVGFETAGLLERGGANAPVGFIASGRHSPATPRHETTHLRDDDGLIAEITALSGTDPQVLADPDMRDMILPALRADYTAVETYRRDPGLVLRCPITVFTGTSDPRVTDAEARAWDRLTTGAFRVERFPGGHFYLDGAERAVAAALLRDLHAFSNSAATTAR
ncbi:MULTISPECIES: thioesterase II family protein [unclassified Streptomyces]|uniref:thioesterase II family protein n=1 Tax=unclassified Streptomyces TaxID=2593676 RepID=UPI00225AEA5A|nr:MULTISPECIES: alpha/beta fold hydrolase [unclassified Streptomyces]MCX5330362.1 alpha/beta fold hydrolase [Streptomyces sp. NBC_00140]MCX5359761.1 alpha/beta fold hydrolase [Streptomyces sp. NBC_00124]